MIDVQTMKAQDLLGKHFYKPGVGAATFALKGVSKLVQAQTPAPPTRVREQLDRALAQLLAARGLRFDWDNRKKMEKLKRKGAPEADGRVDRAVTAVYETAEKYLEFDPGSAPRRLAEELIEEVFPDGVWPITSIRYEEQHNKINELLERLNGALAGHVDTLNLRLLVDRLAALNLEYGALLSALNNKSVNFEKVAAAESLGVEGYFEVILVVWTEYLDDPVTRAKLLAPVVEQNTRMAEYYKKRRTPPQVDPETGDEIPTPQDADESAEDEAGDTPAIQVLDPGVVPQD